MTKEELKNQILELKIDADLESELLTMVENAKEVNDDLLNAVATIIEARADLHDYEARLWLEEAKREDKLNAELDALETEKLEAMLKPQKPTENPNETNPTAPPAPVIDPNAHKAQDEQKIEEVRQVITASASAK